jgi:hypothetical protein
LKGAVVVKIKIEATAENVRRFEYEIDK